MKYLVAFVILFFCLGTRLLAEDPSSSTKLEIKSAYYFPNHEAYGTTSYFVPVEYGILDIYRNSSQRSIGSYWGATAVKAEIDQKWVIPVLVGQSDFTKGNNIALSLSGELSLISVNANAEVAFTPLSFLEFSTGAGLGSGWSLPFAGIGLGKIGIWARSEDFGGLVYHAWARGTIKFDMASLAPGDWNHIIMSASPKIEYKAYTNAEDDRRWIWENDDGMNFNGWKLQGCYSLGYQMPIALNTLGMLFETEEWLGSVRSYSPIASSGWGSDFRHIAFSLFFDITINDKSSIEILSSIKNNIKWTDATTQWTYLGSRIYENSYWCLNRIVLGYSIKL